MSENYTRILKIRVDGTNTARVLISVRAWLDAAERQRHKFLIVTPNPEIILAAQKDQKLSKILNDADICLPDGAGLVWAAKVLGYSQPKTTVRGRELFLELVKLANKKRWKIFLLGDDGASEAQEVLERTFKKVEIESAAGPRLNKNGEPVAQVDINSQKDTVERINKFKPNILFVAFGAPKQEKWLAENWKTLDIGGAMVVGGALDYVNGRAKLPPPWLAEAGLEWLWRLVHQPWGVPRVFAATVTFPLKVIISSMVARAR